MTYKHLVYCPWTGLGLYNGFRGNGWLKNRIKIFKQFVIPSLQNQSVKDFTLWCSWRPEEKRNPFVKELMQYLETTGLDCVHTFHGICFWDDKYPDDVARDRLLMSLHGSLGELFETVGEAEEVLMTIQPSDDIYHPQAFEWFRESLADAQLSRFNRGYVINYQTKEVCEWNPTTHPPFFTMKFPRAVFLDPLKHFDYSGPYKSHEYAGDNLKCWEINKRGYMVGTHGENISTVFDHPFNGGWWHIDPGVYSEFNLNNIPPLILDQSLRRKVFNRFPYAVKRKLRYLAGEKKTMFRPLIKFFYEWIRG